MNKVASGSTRSSVKIKRSEFIGILQPVESLNDFQRHLKLIKKEFHNARHICRAYRLWDSSVNEYSSDDGEPSGSAGQPILTALRNVNAVFSGLYVVRYFGGIKLGKRGLINAYSECADRVCKKAKWEKWIQKDRYLIKSKFRLSGKIDFWIRQNHGRLLKDKSAENLEWEVELPRTTNVDSLINLGANIIKEADTTKPRR